MQRCFSNAAKVFRCIFTNHAEDTMRPDPLHASNGDSNLRQFCMQSLKPKIPLGIIRPDCPAIEINVAGDFGSQS